MSELDTLREIVRAYLDKHSSEQDVRRLMADGSHDPAVWRQLARELGLHGLAVPEEYGGSGAGATELGVVFEELGAALFCGPFLATVGLAATALVECATPEAAARFLPAIVDGSLTATLVHDPTAIRAVADDGVWRLTGAAPIVLDGGGVELLLVAAGDGLFAVTADTDGVTRHALTAMDQTRPLADVRFEAARADLVSGPDGATEGLARTLDRAAVLLAAEQVGGAARVLSDTVAYARARVQFGRAIGSFQAVKHRCADMLVDVESARSTVQRALWCADHDPRELPAASLLARSVVGDAALRVAEQSVQVHGGLGFTWEHPAHLYLKRAASSRLLWGSPVASRARLASLLDVGAATGARHAQRETPLEHSPLVAEAERFLAEHPVPDPADPAADRIFRAARFDAGLARVDFDIGQGGRGADPGEQGDLEAVFARAGAADHSARNVIGLGMALPTIHAHGTEEQRARFLRTGFTGEEIWCQLFSEPGAGSDLAALATRAVPCGDHFVVTGQKVWTSLGHVAARGLLLARTDPDVPKHRGLTYFLLDMHAPGVEVRPLRQLTGEAEFNEVYLNEVHVPAADVLGAVGAGWRVAMTTLANERVSLGGQAAVPGSGPIGQAVELYRAAARRGEVDAATTEALMQLWTRAEAARLTSVRAAGARTGEPGPEGSIAKLQMAELNQAIYRFCLELCGQEGVLVDTYALSAPVEAAVHGGADVRKAYLRSLANSIEGGTSEIQRTILGERVLGLPGEPRSDRTPTWKDVPRS